MSTLNSTRNRTNFDHFIADYSKDYADQYATRRPEYPTALVDWLAELAPATDHAWDAGTGTGQLAIPLASRFRRITASDASVDMLANAERSRRVTYRHWVSEKPELPDASVDLITAAMAIQWFDPEVFRAEATRVLRPGGVLAALGFYFFAVDNGIGDLVKDWYLDRMTAYERPQVTAVRKGYADLSLPFEPIDVPTFTMQESWTFHQLAWFLKSWVVITRAREAGVDELPGVLTEIAKRWPGDPETEMTVTWPLFVHASQLIE